MFGPRAGGGCGRGGAAPWPPPRTRVTARHASATARDRCGTDFLRAWVEQGDTEVQRSSQAAATVATARQGPWTATAGVTGRRSPGTAMAIGAADASGAADDGADGDVAADG